MRYWVIIMFAFAQAAMAATPPNVVVLLVDDMGYSDPGYMGGEAKTPNLDKLSREGVTFLNCFNNAKCAPSRAALMTGMTCQRVKAFKSKGNIAENNATSIAEVLGENGYSTILAGKWHVAPEPMEIGFQHYHGVNLAPLYFKRDVIGRPGEKKPHPLKLNEGTVDPQALPDDWYSTRAYTDYAIKTVRENALDKGIPFFLYLAVNAPHAPLSAPKEVIKKYDDAYDDGTDAARKKRYDRMVKLGIINPDTLKLPAMEQGKDGEFPRWKEFSDKEKRLFKRKLAITAAMVDIIDQETGKLIAFLKETKQYDNTVFIFLSDNGASAEQGIYGGLPFEEMTDRDIDVLGTREGMPGGASGAIVAAVQNVPFRGYKTSLWDGGMHTSMIINWPGRMNKHASDGYVRTPVSIYDLAPTVFAATGVKYPAEINGRKLKPMDGVSILPILKGKPITKRNIRYAYKSEQVIRNENFKLFGKRDKKGKETQWQLFDLSKDESEISDVIKQHPEVAGEMISVWNEFDKDVGIVSGYDDYFGGKKKEKKRKQ